MNVLLLLLFSVSCLELPAQNKAQANNNSKVDVTDLYLEIAHMDSILFDAFNKRDVATFKKLFTTDLEFFHDKDGLTNYAHTITALENVTAAKIDLKRELVAGSLEVFPLKDYGAIQIGRHRFCHTEKGKPDCGIFKFVHIWKKTETGWKITRVVSYDHK